MSLVGKFFCVGLACDVAQILLQKHETPVRTRHDMLHTHWRSFSIILQPRGCGCVDSDHTIDPKLKHADFICGTPSTFRSCKVASFVPIACHYVNLETDTVPRRTCNDFTTSTLCLGKDRHNAAHGHSPYSEFFFFFLGVSVQQRPHKISKIAHDTNLALVSSAYVE